MNNRIGVIGCGEIARLHREALRRQNAAFCAAYDADPEALSRFCREDGSRAYPSAEALLADAAVDTVLILTRHDSHVPLALEALRAGKRVFLEKPLALRGEEAKPLMELPQTLQRRLTVGYNMRHTPVMTKLRTLLEQRAVRTESFRASMTGAPFMAGWASDPRTGGGVLVCQGSHMFDLITDVTGSRIQSIHAVVRHVRVGAERMPDMAALLLRLENGAVGTLLLHDQGSYAMHVEPGGGMVNLALYSREGCYEAEAYGGLRYDDGGAVMEIEAPAVADRVRDWGYEMQMQRFLGNSDRLCTLEEAAYALSCVDAAAQSARSGAWVDVQGTR